MKKFVIILISFALLYSCKEEAPGVNYNPPTATLDTTYIIDDVPTAQLKEVLLEDMTGPSCQNCPEAAAIAKSLKSNYQERLNIIAMVNTISAPLTNPVKKDGVTSKYDFRTIKASEICQMVSIPGNLPMGYVNRNKFTGKLDQNVPRDEWASAVSTEMSKTTPVNIVLTGSYDNVTKEMTADVTLTYTSVVSNKNYISVTILEDSIIDAQESKDANSNVIYIQDYEHRHIMRDMFTASVGDLINKNNSITLTPGRVVRKKFVKKVERFAPYSHWKIVAYVHEDPTSKYVLQSKECSVD